MVSFCGIRNALTLIMVCNFVHANEYAYHRREQDRYISEFDEITRDSYAETLPSGLTSACSNVSKLSNPAELPVLTMEPGTYSAQTVQETCGKESICVIPYGSEVVMDGNLNLGAFIVQGQLLWNDETQGSNTQQWLCAGYVVVEDMGQFNMTVQQKEAFIYVKNNLAEHSVLGSRVFGGLAVYQNSYPIIDIQGRQLARTWSLLAEPASVGSSSVQLAHDPIEMGWRIGDRIAFAPTVESSKGVGEHFTITSIDATSNTVELSKPTLYSYKARNVFTFGTDTVALMSAEIIHLSRSILVTGDDFEHVTGGQATHRECDDGAGDSELAPVRRCTMGLHTILAFGGVMRVQHTRLEKCGQRSVMGRYCLHFHLVEQCPDCLFNGNAIEFGQQRGIVVHGTHLATVEHNVLYDIRGANIYIEDGNEMYNSIMYNVAICPWPLGGAGNPIPTPGGTGCSVPGTDNAGADDENGYAGIWGISQTNYVVGNRMANHYNGFLFEVGRSSGQGLAQDRICPQQSVLARLEGNTFHGHARFGTYLQNDDSPRYITQLLENNGFPDLATCDIAYLEDGTDNGYPQRLTANVDYDSVFVGGYNMGDIAWDRHTSISNLAGMYWKNTKNFADGCQAHITNAFFSDTGLALPDAGAFLLQNTRFEDKVVIESCHHGGELCSPNYVFDNCTFDMDVIGSNFFVWNSEANDFGGIFSLAPPEASNPNGNIFPAGYCSLVSKSFTYLLALRDVMDAPICERAEDIAVSGLTAEQVKQRYFDGILCKRELRTLKIWSRDQTTASHLDLDVRVSLLGRQQTSFVRPYFHSVYRGGEPVSFQGYSLPVVFGTDFQYSIALVNPSNQQLEDVPQDWIIEFSEIVFGNRWGFEELKLTVKGRNCQDGVVSSHHDRRFLFADFNEFDERAWGRGACTEYPPMKTTACAPSPELPDITCDADCDGSCTNGFCECGTKVCKCDPGFTGENCEVDLCAQANCGANGRCAAKYLGADLEVELGACVCHPDWVGENCEIRIDSLTSEYLGCYIDQGDDRAVNEVQIPNPSQGMSIDYCERQCRKKGFPLFALQYGVECRCGTMNAQYDKYGEDANSCTIKCPGDENSFCGNGNRNSVYFVNFPGLKAPQPGPGARPPPPPLTISTDYVGCFIDQMESRTINDLQIPDPPEGMTITFCAKECAASGRQYKYAALQYGMECRCGVSTSPFKQYGEDPTSCTTPCTGDPNEFCGNGNRNSVYRIVVMTPTRSPSNTALPDVEDPIWVDGVEDPIWVDGVEDPIWVDSAASRNSPMVSFLVVIIFSHLVCIK